MQRNHQQKHIRKKNSFINLYLATVTLNLFDIIYELFNTVVFQTIKNMIEGKSMSICAFECMCVCVSV